MNAKLNPDTGVTVNLGFRGYCGLMRIGELAKRTGVSVRSLRYYETEGLLRPDRWGNGYRTFAEDDIARVLQIQLFYSAGLCSGKIAELLPCVSGDHTHLVPSPELTGELEIAKTRIQNQISLLTTSLSVLERVLAAAKGTDTAEVPVPARPVRRHRGIHV
ncbi:MerR family transcriptional regulator [Amycolatopsis japonica]|uniref:MerR family transcriptional regulator n=1 Tax=Amycolatopsis japonica TaxID=208439 RepID=UPI00331CFD8C